MIQAFTLRKYNGKSRLNSNLTEKKMNVKFRMEINEIKTENPLN